MAGTDYGVITLKDGKLVKKETGFCLQGTAGYFSFGNILFDRTIAYINSKKSISFNRLFESKKKVFYWYGEFDGQTFKLKTKPMNKELDVFLTTFYFNNSFFKVLHGYDVSLNSFHHISSKKIVSNFLS